MSVRGLDGRPISCWVCSQTYYLTTIMERVRDGYYAGFARNQRPELCNDHKTEMAALLLKGDAR